MVKILQLYDLNHVKLEGLTNYKEFKIEREINVLDTLSFLYPNLDFKHDLIQEECYIRTKENEYVVKEINVSDDWTEYICKVNIEDIKGNYVSHFETVEQTCTNALNLALVGTGWTIGTCNVTKLRTTRKKNSTSYAILQEIQSIYDCEMTFDSINKKVFIYQSVGSDKGTYFSEQLNLKKLDVQRNSYEYVTRLIPSGKDGLGIGTVNGGLIYIDNNQYSDKTITAFWEDNRYTDAQTLMEDGITRLSYLSKPYKAYKANVIDLASISSVYTTLDYELGDTITLLSKSKNTKEKQRIIKITEYPEEPEKNTCEIANKILKLEDLQMKFIESSDIVDTVTTNTGEIDGNKVDSIDWSQLQNIHIVIADIQDLSVVTARIGTLEATTATITQLNATNASIVNLQAEKANISDLVVTNATITDLEVDVASINTLLAGNIGAANIATGAITAGSGIIASLAIGDAQISTVNAGKLIAGTVDTSKVTIAGANGRLKITGNRLQVFAGTTTLYERVSVGDVNADGTIYGIRVRGADGVTVLLDETGVKREGITDGSINNAKIGLDAAISGTKLDISSVVVSINGGITKIQGSKVFLNNSTLDVEFNELVDIQTAQGSTIATQGTSIITNAAAIALRATTSSLATTNSNVGVLTTRLTTAEASIITNANAITLRVTQTQVDTSISNIKIGGRNLIPMKNLAYVTLVSPSSFRASIWASQVLNSTWVQEYLLPNTQYTFSGTFIVEETSLLPLYSSNVGFFLYDGSSGADIYLGNVAISTTPQSYTIINTFTTPSTLSTSYRVLGYTARYTNGVTVEFAKVLFRNIKLEKGNKATDWSPAPEDIQSQIDETTTRISTAETSITQLSTDITLKASKTSLDTTNTNIDGLTTRMSTAESSLTVHAGQIATKVDVNGVKSTIQQSATDVQFAFNSINSAMVTIDATGLHVTGGTISADVLKGGTLKLGGVNNVSGKMSLFSDVGIEYGTIDKSGIHLVSAISAFSISNLSNDSVYISANTVTVASGDGGLNYNGSRMLSQNLIFGYDPVSDYLSIGRYSLESGTHATAISEGEIYFKNKLHFVSGGATKANINSIGFITAPAGIQSKFHCNADMTLVYNAPWYGMGAANLALAGESAGNYAMQVAGYWGLILRAAGNTLIVPRNSAPTINDNVILTEARHQSGTVVIPVNAGVGQINVTLPKPMSTLTSAIGVAKYMDAANATGYDQANWFNVSIWQTSSTVITIRVKNLINVYGSSVAVAWMVDGY